MMVKLLPSQKTISIRVCLCLPVGGGSEAHMAWPSRVGRCPGAGRWVDLLVLVGVPVLFCAYAAAAAAAKILY
jgi:hypothetical protein